MKFPPNFLDNYPKIDWKSPHYYSIMRFSKMQLRNIWWFLYHTSWKLHSNFGLTSAHDAVLTSPQQATKLSPVARIQCLQFMFLQTTDMSKADICSKHGTSHSRYILISWVSHQELEGTETVLFQANKSAKHHCLSHTSAFMQGHLMIFVFSGDWHQEIFPTMIVWTKRGFSRQTLTHS